MNPTIMNPASRIMNRSIDFAAFIIALPFCIALALVMMATIISAGILRALRLLGIIGGRLLDEAEAFRAGNPRKPRKPNP